MMGENVRKNSALQKSQGKREKHGMLSIYTGLLNCRLLFRLTWKLALEMESLTASLQIKVFVSKAMRFPFPQLCGREKENG